MGEEEFRIDVKRTKETGEIVSDSFAGSGVVGGAALNLKRNCILIELAHRNIVKIRVGLLATFFQRDVLACENMN